MAITYKFSGHESFPCKSLWLKKGYDFVANKNITFYKKAGITKKAFTIKQGTSVKLQKIKTVKNTYYLQFKYGKKTGWIKAGKTNIFKDVVLVG